MRFFLKLLACITIFPSANSILALPVDSNYSSIVEKLIFYKENTFKVYYGGPIERSNGGVQWVMPVSIEDDAYKTREVFEIAFINCDPNNAENAEILFIGASDINVKFKNMLSKDYEIFSYLISGQLKSGKYIVVRSTDISNVFFPEIFISSSDREYLENDKRKIVEFLHRFFKTKNDFKIYYTSDFKQEIEFENEDEISFKSIPLKIMISNEPASFNLLKKIKKKDDWKVYYIVTKLEPANSDSVDNEQEYIIRLDSGCVSGQIYDDVTCDCLDQLHQGLSQINKNDEKGIIVHIPAHDGRGYGSAPKAETEIYKRGGKGRVHNVAPLNTIEAAKLLFSPGTYDIRSYNGAAVILKEMGIKQAVLLTDNYLKVEALSIHQIIVKRKNTETLKQTCLQHLEAKKNSPFYYND